MTITAVASAHSCLSISSGQVALLSSPDPRREEALPKATHTLPSDAELAARDAELAARDAIIKSILLKLSLK